MVFCWLGLLPMRRVWGRVDPVAAHRARGVIRACIIRRPYRVGRAVGMGMGMVAVVVRGLMVTIMT